MKQRIEFTIAALAKMSPAQLREKYLEVFGEPSRSGNKDFLFKRLAWLSRWPFVPRASVFCRSITGTSVRI